MINKRLPRRLFLQLVLASLASGCTLSKNPSRQEVGLSSPETSPLLIPSSTPASTLTPTSHPSADGTAAAFLSAWSTGNYDIMYDLHDVGLALQNADPQILPDTARAFGLGKPTGIIGGDESPGLMPDPNWKLTETGEHWFPGDSVNLAIGQGYLLTTPLQIANMLAAVGNGGTLYRPQLIRRIANPTGSERLSRPEVLASLPVSSEQLAVIRKGLEGVASGPRGTARKAFEGVSFTAAGKTGTAGVGAGRAACLVCWRRAGRLAAGCYRGCGRTCG